MHSGRTESFASQTLELTNVFQTVYTARGNRRMRVTLIHLVNCANASRTVRVCLVDPGAVAAQANAILWDYVVPANDFIEFGEGQLLVPLMTVQALASVNNSVNLHISGIED